MQIILEILRRHINTGYDAFGFNDGIWLELMEKIQSLQPMKKGFIHTLPPKCYRQGTIRTEYTPSARAARMAWIWYMLYEKRHRTSFVYMRPTLKALSHYGIFFETLENFLGAPWGLGFRVKK